MKGTDDNNEDHEEADHSELEILLQKWQDNVKDDPADDCGQDYDISQDGLDLQEKSEKSIKNDDKATVVDALHKHDKAL